MDRLARWLSISAIVFVFFFLFLPGANQAKADALSQEAGQANYCSIASDCSFVPQISNLWSAKNPFSCFRRDVTLLHSGYLVTATAVSAS
jgi:hypothetical protein